MNELKKIQPGVFAFSLAEREVAKLSFSESECFLNLNENNYYQFYNKDLRALIIEGASEVVTYQPGHNMEEIQSVLNSLGVIQGVCVDIGAHNGVTFSNTYPLFKGGWSGLLVECDKSRFATLSHLYRVMSDAALACTLVTPDNVVSLLKGFNIPEKFDFLSIDIDSYDYFVLDALLSSFRPALIVAEINEVIPPPLKFAVNYDADFELDLQQRFYGQSLAQLHELCERHDYHILSMRSMDVLIIDKAYTEGEPVDIDAIYKAGFKDRPLVSYYADYPFDVAALQAASPEVAYAMVKEGFSQFEGKFTLEW
jgi:hypothetical protein